MARKPRGASKKQSPPVVARFGIHHFFTRHLQRTSANLTHTQAGQGEKGGREGGPSAPELNPGNECEEDLREAKRTKHFQLPADNVGERVTYLVQLSGAELSAGRVGGSALNSAAEGLSTANCTALKTNSRINLSETQPIRGELPVGTSNSTDAAVPVKPIKELPVGELRGGVEEAPASPDKQLPTGLGLVADSVNNGQLCASWPPDLTELFEGADLEALFETPGKGAPQAMCTAQERARKASETVETCRGPSTEIVEETPQTTADRCTDAFGSGLSREGPKAEEEEQRMERELELALREGSAQPRQGHAQHFLSEARRNPDSIALPNLKESDENNVKDGGYSHLHTHDHVKPLQECTHINVNEGPSERHGGRSPEKQGVRQLELQRGLTGCSAISDTGKLSKAVRQHFTVMEVFDEQYPDAKHQGRLQDQKVLKLDRKAGEDNFWILLRDEWIYTPVEPGHRVGVIGEFDSSLCCTVDCERHLLILHPDILISGSRVGSSFMCPRRSVLDERIHSAETPAPALFGTMLHQLFQAGLRDVKCSREGLEKEAGRIVQRHIEGLFAIGESDKGAYARLTESIPDIQQWIRHFKTPTPPLKPNVEFGRNGSARSLCVSEVVDIEESVWSPRYGLKGMIDASMQVIMKDGAQTMEAIMPFELKTGKATSGQAAVEHRAQVVLYTLLMEDRYEEQVAAGLLHYLQTGATQGVEVVQRELVGIVMRRNEHAHSLREAARTQRLPPMLQAPQMCRNCQQLDACTAYHKAIEGGTAESSGLDDLFEERTGHLSASHAQFLAHWDRLIDLEASHLEATRREIWAVESGKREAEGRCMGSMVLEPRDAAPHRHPDSAGRFRYTFRRAFAGASAGGSGRDGVAAGRHGTGPGRGACSSGSSFGSWGRVGAGEDGAQGGGAGTRGLLDLPFAKGDRVVLSTEGGQVAVCLSCTIEEVTASAVQLSLPRRLQLRGGRQLSGRERLLREVWRMDKDEMGSAMGQMRANLVHLFGGANGAEALRRLVVDLERPQFDDLDPEDGSPEQRAEPSSVPDSEPRMATRHAQTAKLDHGTLPRLAASQMESPCPIPNPNPNPALELKPASSPTFSRPDSKPEYPHLGSQSWITHGESPSTPDPKPHSQTYRDPYQYSPSLAGTPGPDSDPGRRYVDSVSSLNVDQRKAIHRVLAAQDYALILGMPGTGKTSTIVHAVRALVARGAAVLLTSYTNSAVDNILLKLKAQGVDFLRIGRATAVHPQLVPHTLCSEGKSVASVREMEAVVGRARVVGVTCLGVTHPLFSRRRFDVCLVDEASQISLPVCLGPLRCARSFVLVGDHNQLPPLVKNDEAREGGMAVSLFRTLSEAHPEAVATLQSQYRMCEDIMSLSNELVYSHQLQCGSAEVAQACLNLPGLQALLERSPNSRNRNSNPSLPSWLLKVVDPLTKVLFLDTDALPARETRLRDNRHNVGEAYLLLRIVRLFREAGMEGSLGAITPYVAQVRMLRRLAQQEGLPELEADTVDRYQGRDKDCILVSFVSSNGEQRAAGRHVADLQRLNVALTRATRKLILIGSKSTLRSAATMRALLDFMERRDWLMELPASAGQDCGLDAAQPEGDSSPQTGLKPQQFPRPQPGPLFQRCSHPPSASDPHTQEDSRPRGWAQQTSHEKGGFRSLASQPRLPPDPASQEGVTSSQREQDLGGNIGTLGPCRRDGAVQVQDLGGNGGQFGSDHSRPPGQEVRGAKGFMEGSGERGNTPAGQVAGQSHNSFGAGRREGYAGSSLSGRRIAAYLHRL